MNTTSAVITVLGSVFTVALTVYVGWLTRKNDRAAERTDQAAELTNKNLKQLSEHLAIIDALKHDVWDWESWGNGVASDWRLMQRELQRRGVIREIHDLPHFPMSRFRKIGRQEPPECNH